MPKIAVVTGGARRIGRTLVQHLHGLGFDIALHCQRSVDAAEVLAAQLNRERANSVQIFQADLADTGETAALSQAIIDSFTRVDLLVNNASGFEATAIDQCTPAQFDAMLSSNLRGPYFLIQGLLPAMSAGGCIINMLDVHVDRPLRHFNAYGAAKAGLASLTRSLAVELGPNIRVNGIAPGAILWPEDDHAYDESVRAQTIAATPLQRMGSPEDIARTAAFLALEAPFITGQIIAVDGGRGLVF